MSRLLSKFCRPRAELRSVFGGRVHLLGVVAGTVGAAAEHEVGAALQEPVQDGLSEVSIMEHLTQGRQGLVGGDQDGAAAQVAQADDAEEHVGGIGGAALGGGLGGGPGRGGGRGGGGG